MSPNFDRIVILGINKVSYIVAFKIQLIMRENLKRQWILEAVLPGCKKYQNHKRWGRNGPWNLVILT